MIHETEIVNISAPFTYDLLIVIPNIDNAIELIHNVSATNI